MSDMGARSTSNALSNLWKIASKHMDTDQAAWFANISDSIWMEAGNIKSILETQAFLIANVDPETKPENDEMAKILYNASYQVAILEALIEIADDAQGLWEVMRAQKNSDKK